MGDQSSRILLVEKCQRGMSPTLLQLTRDAASALRLNLCTSFSEASHRLQQGKYDLVISSLDLADSAGIEIVGKLKPLIGDAALAVLFNDDQWHLQDELKPMGVTAFYKPGAVDTAHMLQVAGYDAVGKSDDLESEAGNVAADGSTEDVDVVEIDDECEFSRQLENADAQENAELSQAFTEEIDEEAERSVKDAESSADEAVTEVSLHSAAEQCDDINQPSFADTDENASPLVMCESSAEIVEQGTSQETTAALADVSGEILPEKLSCEADENVSSCTTVDSTDKLADYVSEIATLRQNVAREKDLRSELAQTLEQVQERCAELEAGQTALIEAEHVAIDREKAARELAEKRVWDLEERLKQLSVPRPRELEEEIERLSGQLEQAQKRARESEIAPAAQLQVLQSQLVNERQEHAKALESATAKAEEIQQRLRKTSEELQNCQWQLKEASEARLQAESHAGEFELISSRLNQESQAVEDLRVQLENANARRAKFETALESRERKCVELSVKIERLEALVNQLHSLADRVEETDKVAQDLERMKMELSTEKAARRRINAQLRKAQAVEEKLAAQQEASKELEWSVKEKEQALADAMALIDELKLGGGGDPISLQEEVKRLKAKLAAVEMEKNTFRRQQMEKLEELKNLYEKSQMERMELSAKLSGRGKK